MHVAKRGWLGRIFFDMIWCLLTLMVLNASFMLVKCVTGHNILVLGGNGMIGSETVYQLLQDYDRSQITIVNRGGNYWDFDIRIKPFVNHVRCSREHFDDRCPNIVNDQKHYEAILDFSSYTPEHARIVLEVLRGRFKRYIYISTDSVYEVCAGKLHNGFLKEEDAIRLIRSFCCKVVARPCIPFRADGGSKDPYGDRKLAVEELLEELHMQMQFEYIILRLPDVLGPRDNTGRWWKYYLWTKLHKVLQPVDIPAEFQHKPMSLVYSVDVARLIVSLIADNDSSVFNQAYNLAFDEVVTLRDVIQYMGRFIGYESVAFDESDAADISFGLPSVSQGPVDVSKARKMLRWQATDFQIALRITCRFYEQAEYNKKYRSILDEMLDALGVRGEYYREFLEMHQRRAPGRKDDL